MDFPGHSNDGPTARIAVVSEATPTNTSLANAGQLSTRVNYVTNHSCG